MCCGEVVICCKEYILNDKYFKLKTFFCVLGAIDGLAGKGVLIFSDKLFLYGSTTAISDRKHQSRL
jgi:hypothetical protein